MDCPICYETVPEDDRKVLQCNHSLCCGCLSKLRANTCPFCRAPINTDNNVQLNDDDREFEDEIIEVYLPIIHHYGTYAQMQQTQRRQMRRLRRRHTRRLRRRQAQRRRRQEITLPAPSLIISEAEIEDITSTPETHERSVEGIKPGHISDKKKQKYRNARNRWKKNKQKINA